MTDCSSITSVTEEDSDESDTTETSFSKASDSVSSVLYSSECNTDDKLTPGLGRISISNKDSSSSKKRQWKSVEGNYSNNINQSGSTSHPFPYGCDPLPLKVGDKQKISQVKKKQRINTHSTLTKYVLKKKLSLPKQAPYSYLPKQEEENFGVDDPDNCLYTDFSDTSSIPWHDNKDDELDDDSQSDVDDHRPVLPDMMSGSWFQAKCFDRYWSHYNFVMEWYRQHVHAINMLSAQFSWSLSHPNMWLQTEGSQPRKKKSTKKSKRRARNRRLAKAKQRASREEILVDQMENLSHSEDDEGSQESELEMEITDEMMDFFAKSFKHRMEREIDKKGKEENSDVQKMQMVHERDGDQVLSLPGPVEQPGVRRTAEMKVLYGRGAPMIHGMETALQMTYDNIGDRYQPKPWPNMPLKIVFA